MAKMSPFIPDSAVRDGSDLEATTITNLPINHLDFEVSPTRPSLSPMSTIFDTEPYRLSWDSAFEDDMPLFQSFSVDPLKDETLGIPDLSAMSFGGFSSNCLLDPTENAEYSPNRAPFDGLLDLRVVDSSEKSPFDQRDGTMTAAFPKHTGTLTTPALRASTPGQHQVDDASPPGYRSPFNGCADRKRKSSGSSAASLSSRSSVSPPDSPVHKKTSHNMIEKRYRTNLNDKISALRNAVPSLRAMTSRIEQHGDEAMDDGQEDLGSLTGAQKLSKATILCKATDYIHSLERKNERMRWENLELRKRVTKLETMVLGSVNSFTASNTG